MFDLLQNLMSISDPEHLYDLDQECFQQFPLYFFWKDKPGKYLGCNQSLAQVLGFQKPCDMKGCTDYDLSWTDSAATFTTNDAEVVSKHKPKSIIETGKLFDGKMSSAMSYKLPLRLRNKKVIGIISLSIPFDQDELISSLLKNTKMKHAYADIYQYKYLVDTIAANKLTTRQKECLYYLVKGMSAKEIAYALKLSPRTVEHYLETVKAKLNCHSRSQLIAKVLDQQNR